LSLFYGLITTPDRQSLFGSHRRRRWFNRFIIIFDREGHRNHCTNAAKKLSEIPVDKENFLNDMLEKIRDMGKGKPYDCIIGLSGGVDSSYLAFKSKEWSLRPLLVHVDSGWNTPESENNVVNIAKYLNAPFPDRLKYHGYFARQYLS
jgi:hypothetical protein